MKPPSMEFKEQIARAKAYFQQTTRGQGDVALLRALVAFASSLKLLLGPGIIGREKMAAESLVMEFLQQLNRVDMITEMAGGELVYRKGPAGAKKLLLAVVEMVKRIQTEMTTESAEAMRERKLNIDRGLIRGGRMLKSGRVKEAGEAFHEAVANYRDEHLVFRIIAEQYVEAGLPQPALGYLDKGLAADPGDQLLYTVGAKAHEQLDDTAGAIDCLKRSLEVFGDDAAVLASIGRLELKRGSFPAAYQAAEHALALDPAQPTAKKIVARIKKETGT